MIWTAIKRRIAYSIGCSKKRLGLFILCSFWKLRVLPIWIWGMRNSIDLGDLLVHQSLRCAHDWWLGQIRNVSSKGSCSESWSWTCFWSMSVWHNWTTNWFLLMVRSLLNLRLSSQTRLRTCALSARLRLVLLIAIERAEEPVLFIKHVFEFNS